MRKPQPMPHTDCISARSTVRAAADAAKNIADQMSTAAATEAVVSRRKSAAWVAGELGAMYAAWKATEKAAVAAVESASMVVIENAAGNTPESAIRLDAVGAIVSAAMVAARQGVDLAPTVEALRESAVGLVGRMLEEV